MAPRDQRFELRLDDDLMDRIDKWRAGQADLPARSEAARRLMEAGLAAASTTREVQFTDGDRLMIAMMKDVYTALKIKNAEVDVELALEAIVGGHNWMFTWDMNTLFHREVDSVEDVREVSDIMYMYRNLRDRLIGMTDKERAEVDKVAKEAVFTPEFRGFDANEEATHYSIAHFLIRTRRFTEFKNNLDSHIPMLPRYRRMLKVFKPIDREIGSAPLSIAQVIQIIRAGAPSGE